MERHFGFLDEPAPNWCGERHQFIAYVSSGAQQVGESYVSGVLHASLWTGTAGSYVDLHPPTASDSHGYGVGGGFQVGYVTLSGNVRAAIWNGTAASFVNMHPIGAGASRSVLANVYGGQQVGYFQIGGFERAGLWNGTAESWVNLHPAGATESYARAITGGQQGGWANFGGVAHGGIWSGTATSWLDLHPAGATASGVSDVNGGRQCGSAVVGGVSGACIWSGTPGTWVNLHAFVPSAFTSSAAARMWTSSGFLYVAGYGFHSTNGRNEALLWKRPLVMPASYEIVEGFELFGGTDSLFESDDDCLGIFPDEGSSVAQVEINGISPLITPSSMSFTFEGSVARSGLAQTIRLRRYSNATWTTVDGRVAPITDTAITATLTTTAAAHVRASGELKAQITWQPINDEDPAQDGWLHCIDQAYWTVG